MAAVPGLCGATTYILRRLEIPEENIQNFAQCAVELAPRVPQHVEEPNNQRLLLLPDNAPQRIKQVWERARDLLKDPLALKFHERLRIPEYFSPRQREWVEQDLIPEVASQFAEFYLGQLLLYNHFQMTEEQFDAQRGERAGYSVDFLEGAVQEAQKEITKKEEEMALRRAAAQQ